MQNLSQTYQHYKTSSMSFLYSIATGLGLFQLTETALLSLVGLIVSAFSSIVVQALRNRAETNMRQYQISWLEENLKVLKNERDQMAAELCALRSGRKTDPALRVRNTKEPKEPSGASL